MGGRRGRIFREISWRERRALSTRAFSCRAEWILGRNREGVVGDGDRDREGRCRKHAVTLPAWYPKYGRRNKK